MDKKNLLYKITILVLSFCIPLTGFFCYVKQKEITLESSNSVTALKNYITSNLRTGYRAVVDIDAGQMISESLVESSNIICSDVDQSLFIDANDIGKIATVNIAAGMPIYSTMVSAELAENYRERECSFIWLNTNLKNNDFVDIRILFPNGEDYIVCSKKSIKNPSIASNNVFLWLTEDEILQLDAAIVDANLHDAKIYVTKYLKPEVQEASIVTYAPNADILRAIQNDPNLVDRSAAHLSATARNAMESRLKLFEEANEGFQLNTEVGSNSNYVEPETTTQNTSNAVQTPTTSAESEVEYVD